MAEAPRMPGQADPRTGTGAVPSMNTEGGGGGERPPAFLQADSERVAAGCGAAGGSRESPCPGSGSVNSVPSVVKLRKEGMEANEVLRAIGAFAPHREARRSA